MGTIAAQPGLPALEKMIHSEATISTTNAAQNKNANVRNAPASMGTLPGSGRLDAARSIRFRPSLHGRHRRGEALREPRFDLVGMIPERPGLALVHDHPRFVDHIEPL